MSIKNWKRGLYRVEDQALENARWRTHGRFGFPWHKRGAGNHCPRESIPGGPPTTQIKTSRRPDQVSRS
jgi:hypothetical protein